jgi:hypothetical protein
MPDLFDPLRNLDDDVPMSPLPSPEVRRRGDRMRRRRHRLQALGGAAAVAVIASGTTLFLNTLDTPEHAPVAQTPQDGWLTEIPTHYALDRGWPIAHEVGSEASQLGPSQKFAPFTKDKVEPCGKPAYPSASPVDSVGTIWNAPEDIRRRELTLYADATEASKVAIKLVDAWKACPTQTLPDPPFELTTRVTRGSLGDESWTVVEGAGIAPQLQVFNLVRVGNAVLINGISNEGSLDDSAAHVAEQDAQASALAADMCIFALVPCAQGPDNGPNISPKIPVLDHDALLTTDELSQWSNLRVAWQEIANREDPTLDCQADWLHNLGSHQGAFREWKATSAEAATAVLEFSSAKAAQTAFDEVAGWLDTCNSRLPATRNLTPQGDAVLGATSHGATHSRTFTARDPSGATWQDHQGVALTGSRLVLLAVARLAATTSDDPVGAQWDGLLQTATDQATPDLVLRHDGFGDLLLGMSADDVVATGGVTLEPGTPCRTFQLSGFPPRKNQTDGYLTDANGLESIFARPGVITQERIHLGSTRAEVENAYAKLVGGPSGYLVAQVSDTARYEFGFDKDKVVELNLALTNQSCFG